MPDTCPNCGQQVASVTDYAPRCKKCGRLLAVQVTRPWHIECGRRRCKAMNKSPSSIADTLP